MEHGPGAWSRHSGRSLQASNTSRSREGEIPKRGGRLLRSSGRFPVERSREYVIAALIRWMDDPMLGADCRRKAAHLVEEFSVNEWPRASARKKIAFLQRPA